VASGSVSRKGTPGKSWLKLVSDVTGDTGPSVLAVHIHHPPDMKCRGRSSRNMNEAKPKGEPLLAKQIDKATAELLMDLLDASNDPEVPASERAFALMQAGAILFTPEDRKGH